MTGITLTAEQIRNAPPQVRQWIEQEVMAALGPPAAARPAPEPPQQAHLVACSIEDAEAILSEIEDVLPAINVFFEFGRPTISYGEPPMMAYRLLDVMYHTRLHDVGQVTACLQLIGEALARRRGDATARFCGFDNEGHCFIPPQTQASIAALWRDIAARQQAAGLSSAA